MTRGSQRAGFTSIGGITSRSLTDLFAYVQPSSFPGETFGYAGLGPNSISIYGYPLSSVSPRIVGYRSLIIPQTSTNQFSQLTWQGMNSQFISDTSIVASGSFGPAVRIQQINGTGTNWGLGDGVTSATINEHCYLLLLFVGRSSDGSGTSTNVKIVRFNENGTQTLGSATISYPAAGTVFKLTAAGQALVLLRAFLNGTQILTANDTGTERILAGSPGFGGTLEGGGDVYDPAKFQMKFSDWIGGQQ